MLRKKQPYYQLIIFFIAFIILSSCNNSGTVPFPEKELGYTQPVAVPLQFSSEKKLHWDTVKTGGINPVTKKLDIDELPSLAYDTTGFTPFSEAPAQVNFDFNSLPEAATNLNNLPSKPLQFRTFLLPPPVNVKTLPPSLQKDRAISIFDFGQTHGLPAKLITCLLKDKNGLLWIGSKEGIFRYDGEHLKKIVAASVSQQVIAGIAEDNKGNIWYTYYGNVVMIDTHNGTISYSQKIGSVANNPSKMTKDDRGFIWLYNNIDKAVSIIDPETHTFKNIDKKAGLSDYAVYDILQDNKKNVWITTGGGGADIINLSTGKLKYLRKINGLSGDTLSAITKDNTGQIWLATTSSKINVVNVEKGTIQHYSNLQKLKNGFVFTMSFDNKNQLWMGTSEGIELLDIEKSKIKFINTGIPNNGNIILSFLSDGNNKMWVATLDGLHIIEQNGETVKPLGPANIISILEDTVSNLWIGTQTGIEIIDAKRSRMRLLNKSNGLINDFVQSFLRVNGNILVTTNGGISIIDPIKKTIEQSGKTEGLIHDTIYVAMQDKAGNTWITGPSNGIELINALKKDIRHIGMAGGLSDETIQDIKQDNEGMIWLATQNNGVDVIDPIAGTIKNLNNQPGLKDTCIRILMPDKYGRMWIGTDKGIYVADTKNGTLTPITTKEGLVSNQIISLLQYNGNVVAGTNNKLSIIKIPVPGDVSDSVGITWKINLLKKSEGFIKETNSWSADGITKTGQYILGDRGINIINEIKADTNYATTFVTGIHVMTHPQYFKNPIKLKEKDTLWTADTFFVKGQKLANVGYNAVNGLRWDSVEGPYNLPVNLLIPPKQNYLQFQFAQSHLSRQDTTWYTYVLEGIDKNWSAVTSNPNTENYLNLPPGKYTFKVSSKSISGRWTNPATFSFTISPPWFATWWAYTLFALLGAGILRAYIVYRNRKLQKENKLLEEKVTLRTNQLQKSLDDLKTTQTQLVQSEKMASLGELTAGIAHEIQNPLNFINNFSEVNTELISEMKDEIDKGNLEEVKAIANDIAANEQKINHHGRRADSIVKGMLQHSRSSNGIKEPTDINLLADEYLRLAYHGLRAKDKSFNAIMKTDFDQHIGFINIIPQDMGRVILNLIINAFYAVTEKKKNNTLTSKGEPITAFENYEPTVTVTTRKLSVPLEQARAGTDGDEGSIEIRVKDNGNGIPPKVLEKIFQPFFTTKPTGQGTGLGLSMSYDIVSKGHGGQLTVKTIEGQETEFIITLPI